MAEADVFLICCFRAAKPDEALARQWYKDFEQSIRSFGGKVAMMSSSPKLWDSIDGRDHHTEPHHLKPAAFDFTCVLLAAFREVEEMHSWWHSDVVLELLKRRTCIEKLGLFEVEGLQESFDLHDTHRNLSGDRLILFEFMRLHAFKPLQQYVDNYKRLAQSAKVALGQNVNLLFAEGVSGILMNEFPLEAVCASCWRSKNEMMVWYQSDLYQHELKPLRDDFASCHAVLIPMFEERLDMLMKAKKDAGTAAVCTRLVAPRR